MGEQLKLNVDVDGGERWQVDKLNREHNYHTKKLWGHGNTGKF